MEKYNLDKLVKVKVYDFERAIFNVYKEKETAFFGLITTYKKGFYHYFLTYKYLGETLKNHIVKNGVVYECPCVTLSFCGGFTKTIFFNTLEDANKYANEITIGKNWLLID